MRGALLGSVGGFAVGYIVARVQVRRRLSARSRKYGWYDEELDGGPLTGIGEMALVMMYWFGQVIWLWHRALRARLRRVVGAVRRTG